MASAAAGARALAADGNLRASAVAIDGEAVHQPFVMAAIARGVPRGALLRHAWPSSLRPICAVYGLAIGALLSGSFIVEFVTAWPGLGRLTCEALRARDVLVAACAATGAFLALGTMTGDLCAGGRSTSQAGPGRMKRAAWSLLLVIAFAALAAVALAQSAQSPIRRSALRATDTRARVAGWRERAVHLSVASRQSIGAPLRGESSRRVTLRWFTDGTLVTADADAGAPLLLLGADGYGRDIFSRLLHGARATLAVSLVSALLATMVGAVVGGVAGYVGGRFDGVLSRVSEFVLVLPAIYVALVLRAVLPLVLPPSTVFMLLIAIFTLLGWPIVARGVRAIVLVEREREYAMAPVPLAPRAVSCYGICCRHPLGFMKTQASLLVPAFMLAEATLSASVSDFPAPCRRGNDAAGCLERGAARRRAWSLAPAAGIFAVVLGVNLLAQSQGRAPVQLEP